MIPQETISRLAQAALSSRRRSATVRRDDLHSLLAEYATLKANLSVFSSHVREPVSITVVRIVLMVLAVGIGAIGGYFLHG